MSVTKGGTLLHGLMAAALLGLLAGGSAAAATLTPGTICRSNGGPVAGSRAALDAQAAAAERMLASGLADGERGDRALGLLPVGEPGDEAVGAPTLAAYCAAAGEAMRLARSGSAYQAETYLLAAVRFARQAAAPDVEARGAYRLALASIGGPVIADTRGAGAPARNLAASATSPGSQSDSCAALADAAFLARRGPAVAMSALDCARDRARAGGDPALAALSGLKLSRVQLAAAAAQPQAAATLRASARETALSALPDAAASGPARRVEFLGRLAEAALDAGADRQPPLIAAAAQMRAAAVGGPDTAYALAIAGRLALANGDGERARGLLGQAVFLESEGAAPLRLPTWLLWRAAADPARRPELIAEAYRALEAVRPLLPLVDPLTEEPTFSLRMRPVFEAAVDTALSGDDPAGELSKIARAQEVVEAYRQAEVQSALGADCVPPREPVRPAELQAGEVLLYPILLPDRIELVYARGSGADRAAYRRVTVRGADRDSIARLVGAFVDSASGETGEAWRDPARRLYQLLIKPIEGELKTGGTLVIIPDDVLRAAPLAALLDDDGRFLIERTAVTIAPALSYSQPGTDRGRRPLAVVAASLQKKVSLPAGDFPKLEGTLEEAKVAVEIGGAGARSRLIRDFHKADLQAALSDSRIDVLHVATHAAFNGRTDRSFIVADGEAISLSDLRGMISSDRARGDDLSLLVLSACETAVGDDQASMGLAGAAVQAGAQSALASLWEVSDAATVELMKGFYAAYHAGAGKGAALRQAQLKMIAQGGGLEHPGLWAAFTLLGGWR